MTFPTAAGVTAVGAGAGPVAAGMGPGALRDAYVASINALGSPGLTAVAIGADQFDIVLVAAASGAIGNFTHRVGACVVTGNPAGCAFNPTITHVTVGGIVEELPGEAQTPLETDGTSGPSAGVLAGSITGAVAVGASALGGAAWFARRRTR